MDSPFRPRGLPVLIGSLPLTDHVEACQLVWEHTPQIPLWIQLPAHKEEGMVFIYEDGIKKATEGITTIEEILRVTKT